MKKITLKKPEKRYEKSLLITLLILLIIDFPLHYAQSDQVNYTQILSENGLSQNTVHKILQDKDGFMWFATEDGLNKYDGYNFTVYKNNLHDINSISDNFIWTIYEDRNGQLWIGTNSGGLCKFDKETETFVTYKNNPSDQNSISLNNVRTILEDSDGFLWVGTENGLNKFNKKKNKFTRYLHNPEINSSLSNNVVLTVYEDRDGEIWIGSDGGLDRYNKKNNNFFNYSFSTDSRNTSSNVVLSIYQDKEGIFWIGTLKGLIRFNKTDGSFSWYLVKPSESNSINSNRISLIYEDKSGVLWVGTGDGLYQFDRDKKIFSNVKPSPAGSNILNNNNILSLYEDNSGLIWIGTAEDGIVKYDRERIKFKHFKHDLFNPNSLNHNTIRALFQDEYDLLWIGTLGGGLNCYNPSENKFIFYRNSADDPYSLSDNSVSAVFKDSEGFLWVGTWGGGLNRSLEPYNKKNYNKIDFINFKRNGSVHSISNNIVQAIIEDSKGRLWIGTGSGIDLFDKKKNLFINFVNNPSDSHSLSSNQVQSCLLHDKKGNLWIGTWNGLNKISAEDMNKEISAPSDVKFTIYRFNLENDFSISDERVISAYEDKNGILWFGTYGGGLNKFYVDKESGEGKFINYTIQDGLASNIIYSIEGDDNGNLWLSTDNGLSMFNPETKIIRNYDATDGLQGNQFFWGASYKGKTGDLFFGGTNGFNIFNPKELKNNDHIPPVVITNFQIFNKPVGINTEDSPLKKSITFTKEIELTYSQNVFSFEFSALDYTVPSKNKYAYMMEGFDADWVYSDKRRFVTYTNLDPGEYIFRVKGSNNDGTWNQEGSSVVITILPPLWRTWWFILSALITISGIIALVIYFRVKHLLDIERLRTKLAADLHDNIGSSLTEISILSEVISTKIKTEDSDIRKSLKMISASSRNLIDNMSDIVWLVNPKRDSLYDLILRLRDTYSELSSYTNISFRSENIKSLEKVSLSMEHRQHLYLIFKEAINNSITHSGCSEITLDATVRGGTLLMTLKDNGKGFKLNGSFNGNGLSNIQSRAEAIGGKMSIISKPGEGTTIRFEGNIL